MKKCMALLPVIICALGMAGCSSQSASIGVIGGADGPTAIFVTGNVNWIYAAVIGVIAGIAVIFFRRKK